MGGTRAQLLLPLRNRAAFLDLYFSRATPSSLPEVCAGSAPDGVGDLGGLFIPGALDVDVGDAVDVELQFTEEHVRFHIRARVKWKRAESGRRALPPGVGIAFLASEARTQAQILRFAEGKESVHHVARDRRWSLGVEVRLVDAQQGETNGVTDDISEGGCFVLTGAPLAVGARVELKLKAPGTLFGWLTLPGYVAWRRQEPGRDGVGVEFEFDSARKREKVKRIVHLLKERSVRDVRVPRGGPGPGKAG